MITVLRAGSDRAGRVELVNVRVYRGQAIVFASVVNANIGAETVPAGQASVLEELPVGRPDLPLSIDALVDVIAIPELTLFP